jgi:hypothetical protein
LANFSVTPGIMLDARGYVLSASIAPIKARHLGLTVSYAFIYFSKP